jgi:DNA polymerase III subunit epsilon
MEPIRSFTAFDVETPNRKNDSVCSIGIYHVKDDGSVISKEYIINPEDYFEDNNISIHGINEKMVIDAPRFPEVWKHISEYFSSSIVLAHQASFDLSVIFKTLIKYSIETPSIKYVCTLQKAKRHLDRNECKSYSLDSLCSIFGVKLKNHHNALDDATACAQLFNILLNKYGYVDEDLRLYTMPETISKEHSIICKKALNTLHGILLGINFDRKIYPEEHSSLHAWMNDYAQFQCCLDIKMCLNKMDEILSDNIITPEEYYSILKITDTKDYENFFCKTTEATQLLMGIIEGISCDSKINDVEANVLSEWLLKYDFLNGFYPYDKIISILIPMLEDNHIDAFEEAELLELIHSLLHPTENALNEQNEIAYCGNIFCLTGTFTHGSKENIGSFIENRGGHMVNSISKKVCYLIVGGEGSSAWSFSTYGGKVKKAMELNEKGAGIKIFNEYELFKE